MSIVYGLILAVHVFVCFVLILVILLQAGKGGAISGMFGGGESSIFGGQGPAKPMAIMTAVCAALFMITSLTLSYMARGRSNRSVLDSMSNQPMQQSAPAAVPRPAPVQSPPAQQQNQTQPAPATPANTTSTNH